MLDVIREQAFQELRAALPAANLAAATRCATRLHADLPHREQLDRNLVLVAYGGGKDSGYMLAFVRAVQLILFRAHGSTFRLRVVTNRHAGMPRAVMENIDRAYRALRLPDEPGCELLLVDGDEVTPFDVDSPQRERVVRGNRLDILMAGHRAAGDGRPTFCNACNFSVANSFALAASYGEGADLIVTGDSQQEQRQYALWIGRLARQLARAGQVKGTNGIGRVLSQVDNIASAYFADIHGSDVERRVSSDVPERLRFFTIYADTDYAAGDHMEFLTGFLGFRFDDLAFSFTESDCGNPALMAHLRGLKCERVYRRRYEEGMREYVAFALDLMRRKDFPPELRQRIRRRYEGPDAIRRMRRAADDYALETFGLTEEQLVCMVYAPFGGKGAGLDEFLLREHPTLAASDVHRLLAEETTDTDGLVTDLERISGLELDRLRVLYRSTDRDVIDLVLYGDPHKADIPTRHTPDGPIVIEQISGR